MGAVQCLHWFPVGPDAMQIDAMLHSLSVLNEAHTLRALAKLEKEYLEWLSEEERLFAVDVLAGVLMKYSDSDTVVAAVRAIVQTLIDDSSDTGVVARLMLHLNTLSQRTELSEFVGWVLNHLIFRSSVSEIDELLVRCGTVHIAHTLTDPKVRYYVLARTWCRLYFKDKNV
jgi:hypothetical protein